MTAPFSILIKPTGAVCNLDCEYCFFVAKDELLPGDPLMDRQTAEILIRRYLEEQPDGEVVVAWQGGEPTMRGVDFFRWAFPLVERMARPGQHIRHVIQTNGTLLDASWCQLFAEHHVLVGISVDGPKRMHDQYRTNVAGKGSHDQVMRGWKLLEQFGIERNVLCTVHAANMNDPLEVYRFFRDEMHAEYMQFIPIVERVDTSYVDVAENRWRRTDGSRMAYRQRGHTVTSRSVDPECWGRFLCIVFDEWLHHDVGHCYVQQFDGMLGNALGLYSLCVHAPRCGNALVATHTGDVYPCDHYVEDEYRLGNIRTDDFASLLDSETHRGFSEYKEDLPIECVYCDVRWACNGGCPKDRFVLDSNGKRKLNYLCRGYGMFFRYATPYIERMAELVSNGDSASTIVDLL